MPQRFLIPLILCALVSGVAQAAPPTIPEAVKERARQKVDNGYTPGLVISMVNADGRSDFSYGKLSHAPGAGVTDVTALYEIASVTKTFTAVLLAQMAEAGDVALDDTAASLLPPGVDMPGNGGDTITLEQLANHSSGLPNTPPNLAATITDFTNQFENYSVGHLYEFLESYSLPRAPGASYEYSNTGIALLGHVLALSQNTDYESLLFERVLEPMKIFETAIELSPFQKSRRAPGHHGVVERPPFEMNSLRAAGGLKSCAYDLGTYLEFQLGVRSGEISPALERSHQLSFDLPDTPDTPYDAGLGWWLWDGGDLVQHGGDSFGSTAFVGFRQSTGTGVVILSNNRAHYPAGISDLGFHCLDTSEPLDEVPATTPVAEARLRKMVGDYGAVRIESLLGRPVLFVPGQQLRYTAYDNMSGGLATLDIGLDIFMGFNYHPSSGDAISLSYRQNGGQPITFTRIRHPGQLSIASAAGALPIRLTVEGEGDRDYPLEVSGDLRDWLPSGTVNIWGEREEPAGDGMKYFRIREP